MTERLDAMLMSALAPTQMPTEKCRREIHRYVVENGRTVETVSFRRGRKMAAACMLAAATVLLSVTGYAAWKYLSPATVAENLGDRKLSEQFEKSEGMIVGDVKQIYGGYAVTLLGVITGENLSDYPYFTDGVEVTGRCFAVVAIERTDGTPMPKTSDEGYGDISFFVSAYAKGYDPAKVNIATLDGCYSDFVEDGILYRLVECDDVSNLADCVTYVGVTDRDFYDPDAYGYDPETGEMIRNTNYKGMNALFEIEVQKQRDDQKTKEVLESLKQKGIVINAPTKNVTEVDDGTEGDLDALKTALSEETVGHRIVAYAQSFLGNPYVWGENSLTEGTDSSGFVQSIFANFEMELPRTVKQQQKEGKSVKNLEDAQPGDLIFYDSPAHVAIYLGDGKVIHAMPQEGICISDAEFDEIEAIRRVVE